MRSPAEVAFRLRQETANLRMYLRPPRAAPATARLPLPDPEWIAARLRGGEFEQRILDAAEKILARRIPVMGYEIHAPGEIRWRRDYVHDRETPADYFRRIPYLDFARAGDHKVIWELNRHQHLVTLAQAGLLSGRADFFEEIWSELDSWIAQNPVARGINWTSALEVAFRALSWIWIFHLAGDRISAPLAARARLALYHHGCYLEHNLSIYFSPNTHLQGEALALHALGLAFGVERWRAVGRDWMRRMIRDHVSPDGSHFERSSYYHAYALDMFLFHAVLEPVDEDYLAVLRRMAHYLWAISASGEMPLLGDDDGGRLFSPLGERSRFARATLATCAAFTGDSPSHGDPRDLDEIAVWWLGDRAVARPRASGTPELFSDAGVAVFVSDDVHLVTVAHPFGRGSAGHSHANALHFTLRRAGQDILIDPGTYTYVADPQWRGRFRGTAMHNTVRIDGLDQADPAGPFRWSKVPATEILAWSGQPWRFDAVCRYRNLSHRRRILISEDAIWIIDDILGEGRHTLEQFWHTAAAQRERENVIRLPAGLRLIIPEGTASEVSDAGDYGWRSPVPGVKLPCPVVRVSLETELPCRMAAVIDSRGGTSTLRVIADRLKLGDREMRLE
jgi:Heparinase II/III-like protein/Heparinase II/III N-terminus